MILAVLKKVTNVINEYRGEIEKIPRGQLIELDALIDECCLGNCNNCPLGNITLQGELCLKITRLVLSMEAEETVAV